MAQNPRDEILIDPFHGGRILTQQDCSFLVEQATGHAIDAAALKLEPLPLGLMVGRMLGNLKSIYWKKQDWTRSARIIERLRQISPHDVHLRRDLGICQARRAQPGKAIDHLRAYLDAVPEAKDADAVRTLLHTSLSAIAQWN
jgi:regulator of sirC expression with transglutaminase-like and TPR domain